MKTAKALIPGVVTLRINGWAGQGAGTALAKQVFQLFDACRKCEAKPRAELYVRPEPLGGRLAQASTIRLVAHARTSSCATFYVLASTIDEQQAY